MNSISGSLSQPGQELFNNRTYVTDGQWPDVTCHHYNYTLVKSEEPRKNSALGLAGPVDNTSWPEIVKCCPNREITIADGGDGCLAGCWSLPTEPGVVYQCLLAAGFSSHSCSGPVGFGCNETPLPSAAIASYLAAATATTIASSTRASTATVSSFSTKSPQPTSSANSVRYGTSVKLATLLIVSLLAPSLL